MMNQQTLQVTKRRNKSFLDSSLRLNGITRLLEILGKSPLNFTDLFEESNIKYKKSFLKYLNYCKKQGFIISIKTSVKYAQGRYGERRVNGCYTVYSITRRGSYFMGLVS